MKRKTGWRVGAAFCVALIGCGSDGADGANSLVAVADASAAECPQGGFVFNSGVDRNDNGSLDAGEIDQSQSVCNGAGCTIADNDDGSSTVTCGTTQATITDGIDAAQSALELVNDVFGQHAASVLDVWCYSEGELVSVGTGTKTTTGTVITADHVVQGCDAVGYWSGTTDVGGGGFGTQSGARDLIEISSIGWNAAGDALPGVTPVFDQSPPVGEFLVSLHLPGFTLRNDIQASIGYVVDNDVSLSLSDTYKVYWENAFTSDYAATSGSSGAPVFDSKGRWVAIHVGGFADGLELNYSLPLQ